MVCLDFHIYYIDFCCPGPLLALKISAFMNELEFYLIFISISIQEFLCVFMPP